MSDISRLDALMPQAVTNSSAVSSNKPQENTETAFSDILKNALTDVNDAQIEADEAVRQVLAGESNDIQGTMIALQKADVSLKMMLEVRNKILEAYQEVMRTQV